jgi:hypothetical protein
VDDVFKAMHNCKAKVDVRCGELALGESQWVFFDLSEHGINGLPEFKS